jgi:plasmid stabilization system protein ParE
VNLPVILRPDAEADVRDVYAYLEEARAGLGEQFAARLQDVLERIEAMPTTFGIVWHDVRAIRLRKFRYVVYYIVTAERVEVLAVMHGSRDQSSWQVRR